MDFIRKRRSNGSPLLVPSNVARLHATIDDYNKSHPGSAVLLFAPQVFRGGMISSTTRSATFMN